MRPWASVLTIGGALVLGGALAGYLPAHLGLPGGLVALLGIWAGRRRS